MDDDRGDFVCPACTCLCDDIRARQPVDGLTVYENACPIGQNYFAGKPDGSAGSEFSFNGRDVNLDFATEKAVEILSTARYPLIAGFDALGTRAQQVVVNIGRLIGGALDATCTNQGRSAAFAMQREGMVTATLGEVRQRAEVVVFWFCDPAVTHPRLLERYCQPSRQRFMVVDQASTATSRIADECIQMTPSTAAVALSVCEGILAGVEFDDRRVYAQTGHGVETWTRWVNELRRSNYAAVFFGSGSRSDACTDAWTDCLISFARRLSAETRIVLLSARRDQNALGAENVLAWSTGFAVAVDTCREYGRHYYLEYSAQQILERGECDSAMVFLDSHWSQLTEKSIAHLNSVARIIVTDSATNVSGLNTKQAVWVVCDLKINDDFCRLDDVILPVQAIPVASTRSRSVHEFLSQVLNRLNSG